MIGLIRPLRGNRFAPTPGSCACAPAWRSQRAAGYPAELNDPTSTFYQSAAHPLRLSTAREGVYGQNAPNHPASIFAERHWSIRFDI